MNGQLCAAVGTSEKGVGELDRVIKRIWLLKEQITVVGNRLDLVGERFFCSEPTLKDDCENKPPSSNYLMAIKEGLDTAFDEIEKLQSLAAKFESL